KTYNVKRHFETKHQDFQTKYAEKPKDRKLRISNLEKSLNNEQKMLRATFTGADAVTVASYEISWMLAKHGKPFSDGALVKECFLESTDCLFNDLKNKNEIIRRIKNLQLSNDTVCRRISDISENLCAQLKAKIASAAALSLAVDESTDIGDVAQLCIWIRCIDTVNFEIIEDLLSLKSLHDRTLGEGIYIAARQACDEMNVLLNSIVSVTTDGALCMTGKHRGLVAEMTKEQLNLLTFHCIVHQQALCSKLGDGHMKGVMDKVVKVVNFIHARPLLHRRFVSLLQEIDSSYGDILLHTEVRWLSRGKVLQRFVALLPEIVWFLSEIGEEDKYPELKDDSWKEDLRKVIDELMCAMASFKIKLELFIAQIKEGDLVHFPMLNEACEGALRSDKREKFVATLQQLQKVFSSRFGDFVKVQSAGAFLQDPYTFPIVKLKDLATTFHLPRHELEEELSDLQGQGATYAAQHASSIQELWKCVAGQTLHLLSAKIQSMFGSTYICERTFSAMCRIKSRYRARLTDANNHAQLRCAVTHLQPDCEGIIASNKGNCR
uniref:DUF4371 domain-containing protein n=1 Tax=Latimeria chalumnae TaxID=7897 RepID=H3AE60_LATCH